MQNTASATTNTDSLSSEQDINKTGKALSATFFVLFTDTTFRLGDEQTLLMCCGVNFEDIACGA